MEQDYTIEQVAEIMQVHPKTVEDYINSGELVAYKLRRRKRITPDELRKFRESHRVIPQQHKPNTKKSQGDLATVA